MRMVLGLAAMAVALSATGAVRAENKSDARAVIEKAIKARGGAEKLGEQNATIFKMKGKFYGMGEGQDYTGEWTVQPPDKMRMQLAMDIMGMKFNFVQVFDGKKGWKKFNDQVMDSSDEEVAEFKEEMHAGRVETLVPLVKDKGFELSVVGDAKVGDQDTTGVRVAQKGYRDINLYFDKKSGLLVKSERLVKDTMQEGKERRQDTLYSDYKDVGGVKHPMKMVINRDGEKYVEGEASDYQTVDKLNDSTFEKP